MPDRQRLARVLLLVTPALWSSNYLIARAAAGVISPHQLALLRWLLAFALMLPFAWRALAREPRAWIAEWPHLLALGALGMWICGAFVYIAGRTTTALNIGLIYAAAPVGIAICSVVLLHERIALSQKVAGVLALAGVLFVVAKGELGNLLAVRFSVGDLWVVAAALAWIGYSVLLQRWRSALPTVARLAAIIAGGIAVLVPLTAVEALVIEPARIGGKALGLAVLAAVLPSAFSYTVHAFVQRELGAARTALMLYLAPLYAALLAWLLLGEAPRGYHAVGAALILPSIWLATRK